MRQIMKKKRARDLGLDFDGMPGPFNAITDVSGVLVGYSTLIEGWMGHEHPSAILRDEFSPIPLFARGN